MNLPEKVQMMRSWGFALALAGLLAVSAACGGTTSGTGGPEAGTTPSVTGEVQVTEEEVAAVEETPAATPTPERKAPTVRTARLVRDPFVNPFLGRATAGPAPAEKPPAVKPGATPTYGSKPGAGKPAEPVGPEVQVTGIVRSGSSFRAILTGPEASYIVASGDKLGAYRVTSITVRTVTLSFNGHSFTLKMEDEFGPGGASRTAKGE